MTEEISIPELQDLWGGGESPSLIDVRSMTEFASGHIAGSVCVPLPELAARREDIQGERIVLVCERGMRAHTARTALAGCFPEAQVLHGGMHAWRTAKLPVVRSTETTWSLERQVRLGAGSLMLAGILLSLVFGRIWLALAAVPAAGLVLAGITDLCPLGMFLGRMPWNAIRTLPRSVKSVREAIAK